MRMKKIVPAANPDAYVAALTGWQRECVEDLRATVRKSAKMEEVVKWGHLVYIGNGPVMLIRAEDERVLLGFWRGKRLQDLEPRIKTGGKYEMGNLVLTDAVTVTRAAVKRLTIRAVELNEQLGNPTDLS
jgi:hypothetical protein